MPIAAALARRHAEYGVRPEHYVAVGESLFRTMERILTNEFTPEVRKAWETAHAVLAEAMIETAYCEEEEL